jgi:hypothetical protein
MAKRLAKYKHSSLLAHLQVTLKMVANITPNEVFRAHHKIECYTMKGRKASEG